MTRKDEPVVVMAEDLMLAASQQGLNLDIGEAGIILGYLEGHEYSLMVDGEGGLLRHDEQYGTDHREDMPYTIQDAILFCQEMNEDLIRDEGFWGRSDEDYLSQLRQDEQVLAALMDRQKLLPGKARYMRERCYASFSSWTEAQAGRKGDR